MKKITISIFCLFFSCTVFANNSLEGLLNKVTLRLHTENWVTTKTALVNVAINAAVSDQGIEKVQTNVMQKLNQLVSGVEWHIVSFDRQQDKSGLESIQITAQARLPQNNLANLRDKAKAMSKPGETFTIDNVQFIPSEEELQTANIALRNNIYQQAKTEIDALNAVYPSQKFYLHQIDFMMPPMPVGNQMYMAKMETASASAAAAPPLSVGNKQELQATIVIAAMPDVVMQKLNRTTP